MQETPEHAFAASWLSLREPYDHRARSSRLSVSFCEALPDGATVLDLGSGLGSNLRYTRSRSQRPSRWLLADHDRTLLDAIDPSGLPPFERHHIDLDDLSAPWPEADAVTTQALLDLVGIPWLERLAEYLARARRPLLAALSVDGRVSFHPSDPEDDRVMRLFRQHQLTDRGFGPSLGPRAAPWFAGRLQAAGFTTQLEEADWQIPGSDTPMIESLTSGIAGAAAEMVPGDVAISGWLQRRLKNTEQIAVGHLDLLALPS